MPSAPPVSGDRWLRRRTGISVARALGTPTRAGIYEHLQQRASALTVRDVAGAFDLHPNVARTHLETLADAGLVVIGRRKHPGGGRPAKVYLARDDAAEFEQEGDGTGPAAGSGLLVRLLVELADPSVGLPSSGTLASRAHDAGAAEGRRLVGALPGLERSGLLGAAAQTAARALRTHAPEARVVKAGREWVDLAGIRTGFGPLRDLRPELADALERGLWSGALTAAGTPAMVSDAGTLPAGGHVWRARAAQTTLARTAVDPSTRVDARGSQRETGVVRAMRAVTRLRAGEILEVLAEGPGSPAAFARWADRAGHELLGVERATDQTGRPGIRLLIRKGG